ncbi:uncharacterized protein C2orf73 homolog [Lingula anatina]|uniref:Uncharacterized protein C2orf73 homolog n=1 Tax=Lingula anatina TaxID=7574 RepID=A0A1S3JW28_LINAN|nr:uncharacterized protein C2orf73 homolog [Lingula anatina]|eukprot:XP_013414264.1 uncharacterized protein C2orf73 homolog [Lingula anatina]
MTAYMPPISRKKRVEAKFDPNTFRIFGDKGVTRQQPEPVYPEISQYHVDYDGIWAPPAIPRPVPDYRINRPHGLSASFLRHNCRFLNEPICNVTTQNVHDVQHEWYPGMPDPVESASPRRTLDTTFRYDYNKLDIKNPGLTRHGCNPNTSAALGIVPVNPLPEKNGSHRFWKERISYEHQYNSRKDPNYPIRAKRHGSFVWDSIPTEVAVKYANRPGYSASSPVYVPSLLTNEMRREMTMPANLKMGQCNGSAGSRNGSAKSRRSSVGSKSAEKQKQGKDNAITNTVHKETSAQRIEVKPSTGKRKQEEPEEKLDGIRNLDSS